MALSISILICVLIICISHSSDAFTVKPHASSGTRVYEDVYPSALYLNVPRLTLPDVATNKLEELDLKNPNEMSTEDYNSYSGAAIGGTLLFFLLPGALVSGLYGALGNVAAGAAFDFVFSALVGGGLAIYLSLRKDELGETVRSSGLSVYSAIQESGLPVVDRQQNLPLAVEEKLAQLDLLSINDLSEDDYDGFAGAAVAGTLLFFILPGALLSGIFGDLTESVLPSILSDFIFSALIGGGAAIYLSLRKDEVGTTVSGYGSSLLDAVDNLLDSIGGDSSDEVVKGELEEKVTMSE
eukprot:CAMPEP_0194212780 /NCGR_PEP_ID=MMETSP0156-20130528/12828_1 /TAXON_ID=33649 /ORGANISM="Thalassionema nitzschioides, Strain L26-B" /LENGTH=296 /DNA_ID=CAMNT_0038940661 /DNA_START=80 /DNA_END=970 /DNA_ORIENTATION=-